MADEKLYYPLGYRPSLDGLRAFGVLPIMLMHGGFPGFHWGFVSVDLFFVLSGYLITAILFKEYAQKGHIDFVNFYRRRAARLFPALTLMLIVFGLFAIFVLHSWHTFGTEIGITALYAGNWTRALHLFGGRPYFLAHTWSLAIEEQFYILWPATLLVMLRLGRATALRIVLSAAFAVFFWRLWSTLHGATDMRTFNGTDMRADGLLLGAALALSMANPLIAAALIRVCARLWPAAVAIMITVPYLDSPGNYHHMALGGFSVVAVCGAVVLTAALNNSGFLVQFLSNPLLRWIGARSYGLYLWHYAIATMSIAAFNLPTGYRLTAIEVTGAFIAASLSYKFIEMPFLRKKYVKPSSDVAPTFSSPREIGTISRPA